MRRDRRTVDRFARTTHGPGHPVAELKRFLKAEGVTYAALAKRLDLSESSVKRLFATPEQEEALLADPKLLLMTYLLINGWTLEEIIEAFAIEVAEAERLLIRLHRAKIIELLPLNRVKLLTARNFAWRKSGPVQRFFQEHVQREFLGASFGGPGELFRFVGARLSLAGLAQMQQSIDRLAREFDEIARRDASLPRAERHSCGAVFAIRPWEFSMFRKLRRKQ